MRRPAEDEYGSYYHRYVELTRGANVLQLIQDSAAELIRVYESMDEEKGNYTYAEGKWTLKELLQHMIDCDTVFAYRALCLSRGDKTPLPGFEQDDYVTNSRANNRSIAELLEDFKSMRTYLVGLFKGFDDTMLNQRGSMSGSSISTLALGFILSGHVFHHVRIIEERYL